MFAGRRHSPPAAVWWLSRRRMATWYGSFAVGFGVCSRLPIVQRRRVAAIDDATGSVGDSIARLFAD